MDKKEKISLIEEAQDLIYQAIEILEGIENPPSELEHYILPSLKIRAGEGHGFLAADANLDNVINTIREEETEA